MSGNKNLKKYLILQSFCPLFVLLIIKHAHFEQLRLIERFIIRLRNNPFDILQKAYNHHLFGDTVIVLLSVLIILCAICIGVAFRSIQNSGFISAGETISIKEEKRDVAASFLVSYVLPILIDDINNLRGMILLVALLGGLLMLLYRTNLFYQNPILALLGYRIYVFSFDNPASDLNLEKPDQEFIGISYRKTVTGRIVIKRKYIDDDVFLIFND